MLRVHRAGRDGDLLPGKASRSLVGRGRDGGGGHSVTTWGLVSSGADGRLGRGAHRVHVFGGMRAEKPGDGTGEWAGPDHGPLGATMMGLQESILYIGMGDRSY